MENLDYRAETCSSPIGETGDYDSWIELVTPDFNMQCYDPDVELEQVEELANMLNVAKNCNIHDVSNRRELLFAFIKDWKEEFKDENWDYLDFMAERFLSKQ